MTTEARRRCGCSCGCSSSAAGALCYLCAGGTHRAPPAVRARLERRLELWNAILASSTPASRSGISVAALADARRVFDARWRSHESRRGGQT